MHEGPEGNDSSQPGNRRIRTLLEGNESPLVIRGHKHWSNPFAQFPCGLQVINVDARVVVITASIQNGA